MSYGKEMRRLVTRFVAGGGSHSEAAQRYGVSRKTVYLWVNGKLKGGTPGPKRNHKVDAMALLASIKARPDVRIAELGAQFGVHESTISYALKRAGVTRKKNVPICSGNMQKC